jgi:hypothetical protein
MTRQLNSDNGLQARWTERQHLNKPILFSEMFRSKCKSLPIVRVPYQVYDCGQNVFSRHSGIPSRSFKQPVCSASMNTKFVKINSCSGSRSCCSQTNVPYLKLYNGPRKYSRTFVCIQSEK